MMEEFNVVNERNGYRPEKKIGVWGCLGIFSTGFFFFLTISVGLIVWGCSSCASSLSTETDEKTMETEFLCGNPESSSVIAVIDIRGVILPEDEVFGSQIVSPERICPLIRAAAKDPDVKAILIRLDTPGGEVTASDVIRHELEKCGKPVVAQMESMAASGGYYIATSAKRIVANRTTMTGSIGVVIRTLNYYSLFRLLGLKECIYASGNMKAMLSGGREIESDEEKVVQALVMETFEEFLRAVSESRGIPMDQLRKSDISDGRILSGTQARKAGLVDTRGYFSDAVEETEKLAGLPVGSAKVVHYRTASRLIDILASMAAPSKRLSVSLNGESIKDFSMTPGKAYFLPSFP